MLSLEYIAHIRTHIHKLETMYASSKVYASVNTFCLLILLQSMNYSLDGMVGLSFVNLLG